MMHAHPINRDDGETRGRGRAALGGCDRTSFDHHKFRRNPPRRTGRGAPRSGTFYRLGWTGDLNTIAAVRRLIASGLSEWAATHCAEADHSSAPGHFQCFPERNDHFAASLRRAVPDVQEAIGKDLTRGTEPFVGAAKSHD